MSNKQYNHGENAQVPVGLALLAQKADGTLFVAQCDNSGNLKTSVTGAGSGGTSSVDESAFTAGASAGTAMMGVVNPGDTPANGVVAVAALDAARNVKVNIAAGSVQTSQSKSSTATAPAQSTIGTTAGVAIASNANAKGRGIKNTGTTVLKIGLGANPTQTAYHIALAAAGSADDGAGGYWDGAFSGTLWTGAVNIISSTAGGTYVVTELT